MSEVKKSWSVCYCWWQATSYPVCLPSNILVWGISIQLVLFKEFTLEYTVLTVYVLCLLTFAKINYTARVFVLPILYYCDVVWTPLYLCNILNVWRGFILSSIVYHLVNICNYYRNGDGFIQWHRCLECYTSCRHHVWVMYFNMLLMLPHALARIFTAYIRTIFAKHSFYYRGTQIWNSLNPVLYTTRKLDQFRSVYQSQLIN